MDESRQTTHLHTAFQQRDKPIQILTKYIKEIKTKSHSMDEFYFGMSDKESFSNLKNPIVDFND